MYMHKIEQTMSVRKEVIR